MAIQQEAIVRIWMGVGIRVPRLVQGTARVGDRCRSYCPWSSSSISSRIVNRTTATCLCRAPIEYTVGAPKTKISGLIALRVGSQMCC